MKKILYNLATVALLIFLILKLLVDYCKVPSIYITVGGIVLTLLYCIYFSKKIHDYEIQFKRSLLANFSI